MAVTSRANCPSFTNGLESPESVEAAGGVIDGSVTFASALNGIGAFVSGTGSISFVYPSFASESGTLALWYRKTSSDASGGIVQLGQLGQPDSIGVFYNSQTTVYCEIRNSAGAYAAISASAALSQTEFAHIAVTWEHRLNAVVVKLFLDGEYVDYRSSPTPFLHEHDTVDLGTTAYYGRGVGVIDEFRFFERPLPDGEIYAEYVHSSNRYARTPTQKPASTGPVRVSGKSLLVYGRPFTVKGVGYQPVPIGMDISRATLDHTYTDPCIIARDLPLLRAMNVNTVRFWSQLPDSDALLNALYNAGHRSIFAIMGFWVPIGADYSDPVFIAQLEADFRAYVNRFKDHPAVLGWGIGNENNLVYAGDLSDWYALANQLARTAYEEEGDRYHPTIVVNGDLRYLGDVDYGSDDASLDFVDMWGENLYFGDDANCVFDFYDRISAKPLVITEFGIDAFDSTAGTEYQPVQAEWVASQWRQIAAGSVGGTLMAYSDEWWKAGDAASHDVGGYFTDQHPDGYSNEEWWGVVAVEDNSSSCDNVYPRDVYYALASEFADNPQIPTVTAWGVAISLLSLLCAGTIVLRVRSSSIT